MVFNYLFVGKTIEVLACVLNNPSPKKYRFRHSDEDTDDEDIIPAKKICVEQTKQSHDGLFNENTEIVDDSLTHETSNDCLEENEYFHNKYKQEPKIHKQYTTVIKNDIVDFMLTKLRTQCLKILQKNIIDDLILKVFNVLSPTHDTNISNISTDSEACALQSLQPNNVDSSKCNILPHIMEKSIQLIKENVAESLLNKVCIDLLNENTSSNDNIDLINGCSHLNDQNTSKHEVCTGVSMETMGKNVDCLRVLNDIEPNSNLTSSREVSFSEERSDKNHEIKDKPCNKHLDKQKDKNINVCNKKPTDTNECICSTLILLREYYKYKLADNIPLLDEPIKCNCGQAEDINTIYSGKYVETYMPEQEIVFNKQRTLLCKKYKFKKISNEDDICGNVKNIGEFYIMKNSENNENDEGGDDSIWNDSAGERTTDNESSEDDTSSEEEVISKYQSVDNHKKILLCTKFQSLKNIRNDHSLYYTMPSYEFDLLYYNKKCFVCGDAIKNRNVIQKVKCKHCGNVMHRECAGYKELKVKNYECASCAMKQVNIIITFIQINTIKYLF